MDDGKKNQLRSIYGVGYSEHEANYFNEKTKRSSKNKANKMMSIAIDHIAEKLSIDLIIKELSYASIAFVVLLYMQHTGKTKSLDDFGIIVQAFLSVAGFFNLFKASLKSLFPGMLCLAFGYMLSSKFFHIKLLGFISSDMTNIIVGLGAVFVAISLMKSSD